MLKIHIPKISRCLSALHLRCRQQDYIFASLPIKIAQNAFKICNSHVTPILHIFCAVDEGPPAVITGAVHSFIILSLIL